MFHKPRGTVCEEQAAERSIFRCLKAEQQHPNLQFFGRLDRDTSGLLLLGTDGGLGHLLTSPDSGVTKEYIALLTGEAPLRADAVDAMAAGLLLPDGTTCRAAALELEQPGCSWGDAGPAGALRQAEAALREAAARGGSGARAQIPSPTLSSGAVPSDEAGLLPGSLDQIVYPRVDASELPCVRLVLHEGKFHQVKRMLAACDGYVIGLHREAVGPLKLGKLNIPVGTARAPSSAEMLAILSMLNSSCRVATARKACVATRRREAAS
mmetsp:Transcript_30853/g.70803  ORF Transcript_30853/g.70803 Transcript_30853/m.70803 type:complete len:267 (-) Transcript_30853:43-843(-)